MKPSNGIKARCASLAGAGAGALGALAALPASVAAVQDDGGFVGVDLGLSFWTIITFLLVLWVLKRFAWGPILGALEAREKGIEASIDEAHRFREEAQETLDKHREQLQDARRQAQEIIAESRQAGDKIRQELEQKGREESERLVEQARRDIERERDQALDAIRRESVDLALAATEQVLQEKLDGEKDRQRVVQYLDRLREQQTTAEA